MVIFLLINLLFLDFFLIILILWLFILHQHIMRYIIRFTLLLFLLSWCTIQSTNDTWWHNTQDHTVVVQLKNYEDDKIIMQYPSWFIINSSGNQISIIPSPESTSTPWVTIYFSGTSYSWVLSQYRSYFESIYQGWLDNNITETWVLINDQKYTELLYQSPVWFIDRTLIAAHPIWSIIISSVAWSSTDNIVSSLKVKDYCITNNMEQWELIIDYEICNSYEYLSYATWYEGRSGDNIVVINHTVFNWVEHIHSPLAIWYPNNTSINQLKTKITNWWCELSDKEYTSDSAIMRNSKPNTQYQQQIDLIVQKVKFESQSSLTTQEEEIYSNLLSPCFGDWGLYTTLWSWLLRRRNMKDWWGKWWAYITNISIKD